MQYFLSALTLLFIALKLCGVIAWPWLWVLSPVICALGITLLVLAGVGIYTAIKLRRIK